MPSPVSMNFSVTIVTSHPYPSNRATPVTVLTTCISTLAGVLPGVQVQQSLLQ